MKAEHHLQEISIIQSWKELNQHLNEKVDYCIKTIHNTFFGYLLLFENDLIENYLYFFLGLL